MTTGIVGSGKIGSAIAGHLVESGEAVVLAAEDEAHAQAVASRLGPPASAASVEEAIAGSDAVVLAVWLDPLRELVAEHARLLENRVVVDPTNPIGFDENGQIIRTLPDDQTAASVVAALLPASAHYVKAFGSLTAESLATGANRDPRAVLFYATDDDAAATGSSISTRRVPH